MFRTLSSAVAIFIVAVIAIYHLETINLTFVNFIAFHHWCFHKTQIFVSPVSVDTIHVSGKFYNASLQIYLH